MPNQNSFNFNIPRQVYADDPPIPEYREDKTRAEEISDMVDFVERCTTDWGKFKQMHKSKPKIYKEFCRVTKELIARGHKQYSAYGVMHIVRFSVWDKGVTMKPEEDYKVSNNMTPFYSRLFSRDNPEHKDFFATKPIKIGEFKEEWIEQI